MWSQGNTSSSFKESVRIEDDGEWRSDNDEQLFCNPTAAVLKQPVGAISHTEEEACEVSINIEDNGFKKEEIVLEDTEIDSNTVTIAEKAGSKDEEWLEDVKEVEETFKKSADTFKKSANTIKKSADIFKKSADETFKKSADETFKKSAGETFKKSAETFKKSADSKQSRTSPINTSDLHFLAAINWDPQCGEQLKAHNEKMSKINTLLESLASADHSVHRKLMTIKSLLLQAVDVEVMKQILNQSDCLIKGLDVIFKAYNSAASKLRAMNNELVGGGSEERHLLMKMLEFVNSIGILIPNSLQVTFFYHSFIHTNTTQSFNNIYCIKQLSKILLLPPKYEIIMLPFKKKKSIL